MQRTYLKGLLQGRCPRCREGKIFTYPVSKVIKFNVMNHTCSNCGVRLEPEPGFYQGAMYVGYAFSVATLVAVSFVLYFFFGNPNEWVYIGSTIGVSVLVAPLNYRYSRILYLYFFGGIKYKDQFSNKVNKVIS